MANPLNKFFNFFSKQDGSVLGIDIGSASIKIVQLRRKGGKAILETYGELSLGPYADTEVGRATKLPTDKTVLALSDVLKESNATTTSAAFSIPMRQSLVTIISMPQIQDRQLAQMIPIEARKYIPVPISEVTLDWFVIPKLEPLQSDYQGVPEGQHKIPQVEVLVVAIHNDILSNFSTIVAQAALEASFFEIELFSTVRSVIEAGDNTPVMIMDVGAGATKVYIVERGVIRDSHIINKGSQDITINIAKSMSVSVNFAEKLKRNYGRNAREQDQQIGEIIDLVMSPILSETNSVLLNFQRKYNKSVSKNILIGGGALLNGLNELIRAQLSLPVIYGDPFSRIETPAFLEGVLQQTGLPFATAIGLALRKLHEQG
jgi:type IV pilus assembly protein PilM